MRKLFITALLLLTALSGFSQGVKDLVINEVLVRNFNNYEDDYGHRVPWIEFYNSGYSQVNIGSCFLAISSEGKEERYRIPKGDPRTIIGPQGYLLFYFDGSHHKGIFHSSLRLDAGVGLSTPDSLALPNQEVTLLLYNANGKDTLTSVTYNLADMKADQSWGTTIGEDGESLFAPLPNTTPQASNIEVEAVPAHEIFRQMDPAGIGMAVSAMSVVLMALLCLYLIFRTLGKTLVRSAQRKKDRAAAKESASTATTTAAATAEGDGPTGEEITAIAMALRMYETDLHDNENTVLTINRVAKAYSPWSSKLYGLTTPPQRR